MKLYLLLSIMPVLVSLLYRKGRANGEKKRSYCIVCGVILTIILGVRSQYVGSTDTNNYYNMMEKAIRSLSWRDYYDKEGLEIGFQFFLFVLSRVFRHPQWIIFISSAIYVSSMIIFCYRHSDNVRLSITMYICLGIMIFNMQGMRQSIAMSICLFAYMFAEKKQLIPFLVLVILATLIHKTAIVFSVVYLFAVIELKPIPLFLVVIGMILAVYYSPYIIGLANGFWDKEYGTRISSGGYVATAIYVLILLFCVIVPKHPFEKNIDGMMFYVLLVGFISYVERYIGAQASERISFYFTFSQLILLPNTIGTGKMNKKDGAVAEMVILALCILLFMYRLAGSDLVPFKFCWGDI